MKIPYTATSIAIKGYQESTLAKSERRDCVVRAVASAYDIEYDNDDVKYVNGRNRMTPGHRCAEFQ